ncbi:unnamed protein product [Lymnaea stagnalis]|uniref:CARD domain-containing protein n=1 Tax=Lymnaea stagnalis TaxID=6523 RepID=A0AAV2IET1_LYMST
MEKSVNMLRKGPMNKADAMRIQGNIVFIEKSVDGRDLTSSLYQCLIIDGDDKESVESEKTRLSRIRKLLSIISNRGPNAYRCFIDALISNGYSKVAKVIESSESEQTYLLDVQELKFAVDAQGQQINQHEADIDELKDRLNDVYLKENYEEILKEKEEEMKQIRKILEEKENELQQLRNDLQVERSRLNDEIDSLKRQLQETTRQYNLQKGEIVRLISEMEALKKSNKREKEKVDTKMMEMDAKMAEMQKLIKNVDERTKPNNRNKPEPKFPVNQNVTSDMRLLSVQVSMQARKQLNLKTTAGKNSRFN